MIYEAFKIFAFSQVLLCEGSSFWNADIYLSTWTGEECVCEGRMDRERFYNSEESSRCWINTEPTAESNRQHKLLSVVWQRGGCNLRLSLAWPHFPSTRDCQGIYSIKVQKCKSTALTGIVGGEQLRVPNWKGRQTLKVTSLEIFSASYVFWTSLPLWHGLLVFRKVFAQALLWWIIFAGIHMKTKCVRDRDLAGLS